jgi:hypothetical protein
MFGDELIIPMEKVIVDITLPKFLEEEPAPNFYLFHRRLLLQFIDIALSVVHVERVQVVTRQLRGLEPVLEGLPNACAAQNRFSLFLFYRFGQQQEITESVRVYLLGQKD